LFTEKNDEDPPYA